MTQPTPDDQHVCKPGATTYYCPATAKIESDCHGGFDVCCARPDLHIPVTDTDPTIGELQAAARTRGLRLTIEAEDESSAGLRQVRTLADWLASHTNLGIHLEADGIRRGIANQLRTALGEQPEATP